MSESLMNVVALEYVASAVSCHVDSDAQHPGESEATRRRARFGALSPAMAGKWKGPAGTHRWARTNWVTRSISALPIGVSAWPRCRMEKRKQPRGKRDRDFSGGLVNLGRFERIVRCNPSTPVSSRADIAHQEMRLRAIVCMLCLQDDRCVRTSLSPE